MTGIDYGTLLFSSPGDGGEKTATAYPGFTNCSPDAEQVFVHGTDAVSTPPTPSGPAATWVLTQSSPCSDGVNKYRHNVFGTTVLPTGLDLTNADQLVTASAVTGTTALGSTLTMPCAGSDGAGWTMTFAIVFTASL